MKVLLDSCVAGLLAAAEIAAAGHDVVWMGDFPPDPGDEEVFRRAISDGRVTITIDKDFGELAIVRGVKHCGLVRLVGFRAGAQGSAVIDVLARFKDELQSGAVVTAEPWRVRVRPAEDR